MNQNLQYKKQLEKERDSILMQIHTLRAKYDRIKDDLRSLVEQIAVRELVVTDHAIERFKERVIDIPVKKIKQILTSGELTEAYRRKGDGRYGIKELPNVVVQITDFAVVTVINTALPEERLELLSHYMNYYIDELALKYTGHEVNIMKIKTFKHLYWRNQIAA
jgi:L-cysteine desulfidase